MKNSKRVHPHNTLSEPPQHLGIVQYTAPTPPVDLLILSGRMDVLSESLKKNVAAYPPEAGLMDNSYYS